MNDKSKKLNDELEKWDIWILNKNQPKSGRLTGQTDQLTNLVHKIWIFSFKPKTNWFFQ
jgi:hypothetical protein